MVFLYLLLRRKFENFFLNLTIKCFARINFFEFFLAKNFAEIN